MFLPAFSFTIIGHSVFERLVHNKGISSFLDGITARWATLLRGLAMLRRQCR
jgi:hypothetical protein